MGSIQLGSDITGETSPLSMFTEGSGRCSTGISLPRSSCEAVASFSKASAREFSALGIVFPLEGLFQNLKERLTFVAGLGHEVAQRNYSSSQELNFLNV